MERSFYEFLCLEYSCDYRDEYIVKIVTSLRIQFFQPSKMGIYGNNIKDFRIYTCALGKIIEVPTIACITRVLKNA